MINKDASFFRTLLDDYKKTNSFAQSRIRQDRTTEDTTSKDYSGRELYELLQNAEDEHSEYVNIILDTNQQLLIIQNGGNDCRPFSEEGFCSIMMSGMSPKRASANKRSYIGNKGLGFRSILNWAECVSIVSNGIRCTFSLDIAKKYWEEIKLSLDDPQLIKQHEEFSIKEFNTECPLAVFAIPEVENEDSKGFSTSIEIQYKKESFASIQSQINSLSGMVLLFLKHIKKIDITIDGQLYSTIEKTEETEKKETPNLVFVTTSDKVHPEGQNWVVLKNREYEFDDNHKYGIGLAYDPQRKESGKYIYSFFPTQVRIDLPCVIHATFELNSSRNSIIQSDANQIIKEKIADVLLEFAETLAENDTGEQTTWEYHDLLTLTDNHDFADLADRLRSGKQTKKIYPTIGQRYVVLEDALHYSDGWADYINMRSYSMFQNHLLPDFESRDIPRQEIGEFFCKNVNHISYQINKEEDDFAERCDMICAVLSTLRPDYGVGLILLVDENKQLITDEAHMNVGESIQHLPSNMNIAYVNSTLAGRLIDRLSIDDSNKMRGLTKKLKGFTRVIDMDVNQVKRKIVSFTQRDMDLEGYQQLMSALFKKYAESDKGIEYVKEITSNPEFCLLDEDCEKHFPSELVLKTDDIDTSCYENEFILHGSFNYWKEQFYDISNDHGIQEDDDIKAFFFSALGVSDVVPMSLVPIDENAIDFLEQYSTTYKKVVWDPNAYYSSKLEGDSCTVCYNRYKIPSEKFFNSYIDKGSLVTLIDLIIDNNKLFETINDSKVRYQYRSIKEENSRISFAQYILSKYDCLEPIRSFIVSENLFLGTDNKLLEEYLREISSKPSQARKLVLLGAKEDLEHIPVNELFDILMGLPEKGITLGVQKLYKALREALKKCADNNPDEFKEAQDKFVEHGKVYARKNGELVILPVIDVFYWDNDQLPNHFLKELPKLEIGSRVGEDSVHEIFGVQLVKNLIIQLNSESSEENQYLSGPVNNHFKERIRFILAYRLLNTKENANAIKTYASKLKNTSFKVYSKCTFMKGDEEIILQNGDMISSNDSQEITTFHICSNHLNFQTAIADPVFCENITEAICIVLKVTGSEITNCFRSIVSQPIGYTKYISSKDISEDDWKKTDSALGVSEHEKAFWGEVFQLANTQFNPEMISVGRLEKQKYLESSLHGISLPTLLKDVADLSPQETYKLMLSLREKIPCLEATILGNNAIRDYYSSWLTEELSSLAEMFKCWAYDNIGILEGDECPPYKYYDSCNHFSSGAWAESIVKENEKKILSDSELKSMLIEIAKAKYRGFDPLKQEKKDIPIRKEYKKIVDDNNLTTANIDPRDLSLTLFEGDKYLALFREKVKAIASNYKELHNEEVDVEDNDSITITYGDAITITPILHSESRTVRKTDKRYKSDKELFQLGLSAEKKVFQAMNKDKIRYLEVIGCSRNLNPTNGKDSKHFDILYKKKGEDQYRYLEVKAMGKDSIIMSSEEYEFAIKNKERYDFALVNGDQITIIETPFLQNENHQALQVFPESYKVPLEIIRKS